MRLRTWFASVAALALVAAACTSGVGTGQTDELPPNPLGACHESQPDCNDTIEEPLPLDDEPHPSRDPGDVSGGFVVAGGLTVSEALATDARGVIAVKGFVVHDQAGLRLCEILAESLTPQCGGAFLPLSDLDTFDQGELQSAQGVTWTDHPVTILGEIVDGTLRPTPFSA